MKLWRYGQPIEILGDRYRLEGMLGSGGMADVCLGFDEYEQRQVAIKVVKVEAAADQDMLNRFVKEPGQIVGWQHPYILRVYDQARVEIVKQPSGQDDMLFYMVMEYAAGGDLQKRMTPGEPYHSLAAAFTIMRQISSAVEFAHKHNIIHRDIKPLNILFRRSRTGPEEAVLSDFGLAVQIDASHHTFAEAGSLSYMAPEQMRGQAEPASDIFALGVTFYQLLTGSLPYHREMKNFHQVLAGEELEPLPPSALNPRLSPLLDDVLLQALAPNPALRYRSAAGFWNAISSTLEMKNLVPEIQQSQASQATKSLYQEHTNKQEDDNEGLKLTARAAPLKAIIIGQNMPTGKETRHPALPQTAIPRQMTPLKDLLPVSRWRSRRLIVSCAALAALLTMLVLIFTIIVPLFAITTVTIFPITHKEQGTFIVDAAQIQAHQVSATAPAQQKTGKVKSELPAQQASGQLTFINQTTVDVVIQTMVLTGKSGIAVTFDGPITVHPVNPTYVTVTGHAVDAGPAGNIPAFDIDQYCCAPNNAIIVKNGAFTGGRFAIPNDEVQQSDIDAAAQGLVASQTQQEQDALKKQLKSDEQVVSGSNHCQSTVTPDQPAGTQANTVTVNVTVSCTEEVYSATTAQVVATHLLTAQVAKSLGAAYQLAGNLVENTSNTTNGNTGPQIALHAQGLWAYTFSSTRLSQLAKLIAGKNPATARALLLSQPGIADARLSTGSTLPAADHLQIKVQIPGKEV